MTWMRCEVSWDLDFEPFEKEWRAASGIGGCRCLAWRLFFGIGFDTVIHLCYSTQCSCTKIVHLDIETRAAEPHWSFMCFCWIWLLCFFCRCLLPGTWLGRIVKFIGIWILNLLKPVAGSQWHWGGFGVWPPVLGWDLANARIFICSFGMVLYVGIFHLQFWDGAFWTEYFSPTGFSAAVLRWRLLNWIFSTHRFFTCSFGMAPSKVMSFHSQFFHLQFSDGTLLAQGFAPFKIFPLQF